LKYIFYVNVGDLPRLKADSYVAETFIPSVKKLFSEKDIVVYIPVRSPSETRLQVLPEEVK
jgi:hypothetical protein